MRPVFSTIPGIGSGGAPTLIFRQGKSYRTSDIAALLYSIPESRDAARLEAIQCLVATQLTNRNELCLVTSALYHAASVNSPSASAAQEGLVQILSAHLEHPEGVHIALQTIRHWETNPKLSSLCAILVDRLRLQIPTVNQLTSRSRTEFLEVAHILSQASTTDAYRTYALAALCQHLDDRNTSKAAMRRELATIVLAALRRLTTIPADLASLKELATSALARSTTLLSSQHLNTATIQKPRSDLVTAQQAEQRRQFGLAVTIEIIKSLPLLSRPLAAEEFENALRFSFSSSSPLPANYYWPTASEWQTIERALAYAEEHKCFSALHLAAYAKLLATRIKVEDPRDPRESKRRSDTLPIDARLKVLATAQRLQNSNNFSKDEVVLLCNQLAKRLLAPEFSQWTARLGTDGIDSSK
jgi:hypothetical protein